MAPSTYKRRWRNLLLDKNYQLRFILTWVGVAVLLMSVLGYWVLRKADAATDIALNRIDSVDCGEFQQTAQDDRNAAPSSQDDVPTAINVDEAIAPKNKDNNIKVTILESTIAIVDEPEPSKATDRDPKKSKEELAECLSAQTKAKSQVHRRRSLILLILVLGGCLFTLGLFVIALKMTHRIAGPLFKIGNHLKHLEEGTFDTIYDIRKGDRLVDFFALFRDAFETLKTMDHEDKEQMKALIEWAESQPSSDQAWQDALTKLKERVVEKEAVS